MTGPPLSLEALDAQEARVAAAFAAGDVAGMRDLYDPGVVYVSPTTRLFGWPPLIEGVDRALEFIALTVAGVSSISYVVDERALVSAEAAYVRVRFDFDMGGDRLRSTYVVVYRYRHGRIARQELYYDPSGELERLGRAARVDGTGAGGDGSG
jgi:ketosteroid isomerase-like protein